MSPGRFFCVVGPSGAGKDSLIDAARMQLSEANFVFAKRVITRAPGKPGEIYDSCSEGEFHTREKRGDFLVTWKAHGLLYGLPISLVNAQRQGKHVIVNGSRATTHRLKNLVPNLHIIEITAPIDTLASRIKCRGRETDEEIHERLTRKVDPSPEGVNVHVVDNDQALDIAISRFMSVIQHVCRISTPALTTIHKKIAGLPLESSEIFCAFESINHNEVPEADLNAFLLEYCHRLNDKELIDIARIRSKLSPRIRWPTSIVLDKHSLGGTPGNRVTMVVVPIVAAHGLLIPKSSTRAITSAAGTADTMEVLARVNFNHEKVRDITLKANGCIVWNGGLNHSTLDVAMNRITRPMALDTRRWAVASILSKKYTAGATHVVIDIPYSKTAKARNLSEANELIDLFERTGRALGITVRAFATPGHTPIGRGIGPALEARDVMRVLSNASEAPLDLKEKALFFAANLLAFDPSIGNFTDGYARAVEILDSGAAYRQMQKIIDQQGPQAELPWDTSRITTIKATRSGQISRIDGHVISGIARAAGAPTDKLAGIYLHQTVASNVTVGDTLYQIHSTDTSLLKYASLYAQQDNGFSIE